MSDVTRILSAIGAGDPRAAEELLPLVYDELRKLATQKLACEKPGQTLQSTALVHEAYLRLVANPGREAGGEIAWNGRGHFFAAAAEAMRRILVDRARQKMTEKHGGGLARVELGHEIAASEPVDDLLALDEALTKLETHDPKAAELVKLRYFAGLGHQEAAAAMGISRATADKLWSLARAWLFRRLSQ